MAVIAAETGFEEGVHDLFRHPDPDHAAADGDHVDVVMLYGLVGAVRVVGHGAAHPFDLVGGDGRSRTRSTHQHAPVGPSIGDRDAYRSGIVGVVDRVFTVSSQIEHRVPGGGNTGSQCLFEGVAGVVGSYGDLHGRESSGLPAVIGPAVGPADGS